MIPGRRTFDFIVCDLVGPFYPPNLKGSSYNLTCIYFLTIYPISIPIPKNQAETLVQAYLQNIYTTFGRPLTKITDNGKEFKNDLFNQTADQLGIKHHFLSPYHPQSSKHVQKNTIMIDLTWKIHYMK